jgi:hypothetical protein
LTQQSTPYFWFFFGEVIVYLIACNFLFYYLRRVHRPVWVDLGSPTFLNNSIANNFKFLGFLWGGSYVRLSDPQLTRLIWLIRALFVIAGVMFAGQLVFFAHYMASK